DELYPIIRVWVARHRVGLEILLGRITRIVFDKPGMAIAVRRQHLSHDAKTRPLRVFVFSVARLAAIGNDSFDVPLVGVEQEADERLLVVGFAARVRLDDDAKPLRTVGANPAAEREE